MADRMLALRLLLHGWGRSPRHRWILLAAPATLLVAIVAAAALVWSSARSEADAFPAGPTPATTATATSSSAVVWAVGDGVDGTPRAQALARLIARGPIDRFLYLGDVYESGTPSDFMRHYATVYGQLGRITSPTPGNHEWGGHRLGYDPYWQGVMGRPIRPYYSFSLAGWQILSLNSETAHGPRSPQVRWLAGQLRGRSTCRLAFWHRARYSAGYHGDQNDVAPLWNAVRGKVSIVLSGHDHDLQRFPRYQGITEFVAGAGGSELYPLHGRDHRLAFASDVSNGALRLTLRRRSADYRFAASDGRTLDAGSVPCRR